MNTAVLFLLQSLRLGDFQIQPNPIHGIVFLIGLMAIVVLVVFLNKSTKVKNSAVFKSGSVNKPSLKNPEIENIRKAALNYGLGYNERKFLSNMFRKEGIDSSIVFSSAKSIDEGFSKIIRTLNREEDTDDDLGKLFAIRNKMEYYLSADEAAKKTPDKKLIVRRYKRAESALPVVFYLVVEREVHEGLKKVKKLSLDSIKCAGTILDISSGGCAISTHNPYKTGICIKLEFKIGRNNLVALAKILRVNQNQSGSVLHTRFIKISVKSLNAINTFVYNYNTI
jgi:hypothetical protein